MNSLTPARPMPSRTPPVAVPARAVAAARDLLARTSEVPASNRGLLMMLTEYRAALHALAVLTADGTDGTSRSHHPTGTTPAR